MTFDSGDASVYHPTLVSFIHTCWNTFSAPEKKGPRLKFPQQTFKTFFVLWNSWDCNKSLHCGAVNYGAQHIESLTVVGFIKESSKQFFPAVPSWDMPCGTLPLALPDLNAMWQAAGSKTCLAWCLAQFATAYTTNNRTVTNGWWRVGKELLIR